MIGNCPVKCWQNPSWDKGGLARIAFDRYCFLLISFKSIYLTVQLLRSLEIHLQWSRCFTRRSRVITTCEPACAASYSKYKCVMWPKPEKEKILCYTSRVLNGHREIRDEWLQVLKLDLQLQIVIWPWIRYQSSPVSSYNHKPIEFCFFNSKQLIGLDIPNFASFEVNRLRRLMTLCYGLGNEQFQYEITSETVTSVQMTLHGCVDKQNGHSGAANLKQSRSRDPILTWASFIILLPILKCFVVFLGIKAGWSRENFTFPSDVINNITILFL